MNLQQFQLWPRRRNVLHSVLQFGGTKRASMAARRRCIATVEGIGSGFWLLERFQAKWKPVRVKKTRQIKESKAPLRFYRSRKGSGPRPAFRAGRLDRPAPESRSAVRWMVCIPPSQVIRFLFGQKLFCYEITNQVAAVTRPRLDGAARGQWTICSLYFKFDQAPLAQS